MSKRVKSEDKERDRERDRDEREKERDRERDREKERPDKVSSFTPKDSASHKGSALNTKVQYTNKCISELDLSACQRCTPSYRLLPKHVMQIFCFFFSLVILFLLVLLLVGC